MEGRADNEPSNLITNKKIQLSDIDVDMNDFEKKDEH